MDCIRWWKSLNGEGYGQQWVGSRTDGTRRVVYAHKMIYEACLGYLPEEHEIHHVCENRWCVNPNHMQVMHRLEHSKLSLAKARRVLAEKRRAH